MSESHEIDDKIANHKKNSVPAYIVVQFIKRGRQSKIRQMDIVPSKWIRYNYQRGRCTTKFPEASTNPEDNQLLHDLVKTLADAPLDWNEYTVEIKGRAKTYDEALKKFELLKVQDSALTQSENDEPDELKKQMEEDIKRRDFMDKFNDLKSLVQIPKDKEVIENTEMSTSESQEIETQDRTLDSHGSSQQSTSTETQGAHTSSQSSTEILKNIHNISDSTDNLDDDLYEPPPKKASTLANQTLSRQKENHSDSQYRNHTFSDMDPNDVLRVMDVSHVRCNSDFEAAALAEFSFLRTEALSTNNCLQQICTFLLGKEISFTKRSTDFKRMYNLDFPMDSIEAFVQFDEQLKDNKFLQRDVCLQLQKLLDKDFSITKSYLSMIRAFITSNVAMKYTASRKSTDKENPKSIFKITEFYKCMEAVMLTARNEKTLTSSERDLMSGLSDVLSNAKGWDRSKKKNT